MTRRVSERRVIRSGWAVASVVFVWAVLALLVGDVVLGGDLPDRLLTVLTCLYGAFLAWAVLLRPAVVADPTGLLLRNLVRDVTLPWPVVEAVTAPLTLTVRTTDGRRFRSWALSSNNRPPYSGHRMLEPRWTGAAPALLAEPHLGLAQQVAAELEDMRTAQPPASAGPAGPAGPAQAVRVRWVWPVLAPVLAGGLLLAVAAWVS